MTVTTTEFHPPLTVAQLLDRYGPPDNGGFGVIDMAALDEPHRYVVTTMLQVPPTDSRPSGLRFLVGLSPAWVEAHTPYRLGDRRAPDEPLPVLFRCPQPECRNRPLVQHRFEHDYEFHRRRKGQAQDDYDG